MVLLGFRGAQVYSETPIQTPEPLFLQSSEVVAGIASVVHRESRVLSRTLVLIFLRVSYLSLTERQRRRECAIQTAVSPLPRLFLKAVPCVDGIRR